MNRTRRLAILALPLALLLAALVTLAPRADEAAAKASPTPCWIWGGAEAKEDEVVLFRKSFTLGGRLTGAKLYATCDNRMTVFLNGKRVLQGRDWESPVFADVGKDVKPGRNVLAVRGQNAGGPAGLLLRLVVQSEGRPEEHVVTDDTWKVSAGRARGWQGPAFDDETWAKATVLGKLGDGPWTAINEKVLASAGELRTPEATPLDRIRTLPGFKVELVYAVPKETQGSWVSLTVDPKGRLIASDQYGALYRVTLPAAGGEAQVEPIPVALGEAQGLLWAFDSLYVVVNRGEKYPSGLYRVRDTDGDDMPDKVEQLRPIQGGGEHGPHAVLPHPDGKSLVVLAGNHTRLTETDSSLVPRVWQEDQLLPRMVDASGHATEIRAPGGWICKTDPDGKKWELISIGYRNEYDAAFNRAGELFTYDSDMEWDMSTPWYRPTRVLHAVSGSEFGWRTGTGKWPVYYPDSLPPVIDIGPGSPTGVAFGYGAKFPAKYQDALYLCDWSYGKLYAVHLKPEGASYIGEAEEFVTGTPLPLTDLVVNPKDGAMYFTIGGRRATSGLYRVTYVGKEPTTPSERPEESEARDLRRSLEKYHGRQVPGAVAAAWPHLGHEDRFVRFAARTAIEHQPVRTWREKALSEKDPEAALTALVALARVGDEGVKKDLLGALARLKWEELTHRQRLGLLRAYGLVFARTGPPHDGTRGEVIARFDPLYPARSKELNAELSKMLVYLQAPGAAGKTIALMQSALTQEEQLDYALALRVLENGWTPELREAYFRWFLKAANYRGGHSFQGFVRNIKKEAEERLPAGERERLQPILTAKPEPVLPPGATAPREFVKNWTVEELAPKVEEGLKGGRDFDRGRLMFAAGQCFVCHRFAGEGGSQGPDLTGVAGRFNVRDLLESIVEPSKTVSDQYQSVIITTKDDRVIEGRIVNLAGDTVQVNTNMLDPDALTGVDRKRVESIRPSSVSMMPKGLLDTLKEDEVLDLMAYLLSRGNRDQPMFKK